MKFSKKGDMGETSLLGGQRVPKFDLRPETYGTLDEASSIMGVARAMTSDARIKELLLSIQKDLLILGAELSTLPEDIPKLGKIIDATDVQRIEDTIDDLQKVVKLKNEFIYPGLTVVSSQIDVARTVVRRAERWAARLKEAGYISRPEIQQYLNRLADMLFTLARFEEQSEK
jgi:cob(I)alamin adenosyltransferase